MADIPVVQVDQPARPGLTQQNAEEVLGRDGFNEVLAQRPDGIIAIVRRQLTDTVILVLLVAAVLTAVVGDVPDTAVIAAVVFLNTALGTVQERRSGRALAALADLTAPHATVLRDGVFRDVRARLVVRGDLLQLAAGDIAAADGVVHSSQSMTLDESMLTGESAPVSKRRGNQVYAGTVMTRGRGEMVVTGVGHGTAVGDIAGSLAGQQSSLTPLQRQLSVLGRRLAIAASVAAAVVAALNLLAGRSVENSLVLAVSLAVAAIPESLPAVVALSLALASQRMAGRGVLARRLSAVEALGSVTVIASDKTGTLTQGRMVAAQLWTPDATARSMEELLQAAILCSDAYSGTGAGQPGLRDDPTEVAIIDAAREHGLDLAGVRRQYPRIAEVPFDAQTARMSTTHSNPTGVELFFTKGAPEVLLPLVTDPVTAAAAHLAVEAFTGRGWRVLSVTSGGPAAVRLLGLIALADPIRSEAPAMLQAFRLAGVRAVMITGDHPSTALAVAHQLGIAPPEQKATDPIEGPGVTASTVYARVHPEQKTVIVHRLHDGGEVVAMTGDGVNDAPALRAADVGIAMGRGTEVAKQAAAIVLTGDDLSALIPAIGEGRRVYDNLRRFLHYAVSGGAAEVLIMLFGPFLGMPVPLQAGQILWVNLLTHGLPGVAMGNEPAAADVFTRPPRPPAEQLLDAATARRIGVLGIVIAALTLLAGGWSALAGSPAQNTVFLALTFAQLGVALALRPKAHGGVRNRMLLAAVGVNIVLTLQAVLWNPLRELLRTAPLAPADLLPALTAAALAAAVALWQARHPTSSHPLNKEAAPARPDVLRW